jgi:LysM repeat protein
LSDLELDNSALTPSAAKKKYTKLYNKSKTALTKAKIATTRANNNVNQYKYYLSNAPTAKAKAYYKKELAKVTATATAKKNAYTKAKSAEQTAKRNLSRYKKSPEVSKFHMNNILINMKQDKDWDGRGYIVPLRPWTDNSYALIYITDFQPTSGGSINDTPVERGFSVSTAGQKQAKTASVTGYLGGDPEDKMKDLLKVSDRLDLYCNDTTSVKFVSDQVIGEGVITAYTPDFNHAVDGGGGTNAISISMTINYVTYADSNPKPKKKKTTDSGKKPVTKGTKKKGTGKRYIVAKKGDTYWGVATKHKVSLASVEKLNKYAARSIPIGAKIYY